MLGPWIVVRFPAIEFSGAIGAPSVVWSVFAGIKVEACVNHLKGVSIMPQESWKNISYTLNVEISLPLALVLPHIRPKRHKPPSSSLFGVRIMVRIHQPMFNSDCNGPSTVGSMSVVFSGRIIALFPSIQALLTQIAANIVGAVLGGVVEEAGVRKLYPSKREQINLGLRYVIHTVTGSRSG